MAYYAALLSLVQLIEEISHRDRYQKFLLEKQQFASVYEKFRLLQASLEDYYSPKDEEAADSLERRIRDAAYQAQDIIESQFSSQIPQQLQNLEKVKEEVDSIMEEVMMIEKSHTTEDLQLNYIYSADTAGASKQASRSSGGDTMVGFDEPLATIKDQLDGESSKLQVVSIVGMGGIGKTTLARNVFDDKLIVYRFDCRVWITVSQEYHLRNVLLRILDSMNINKEELSKQENHVLEEHIYKHLKGRRYLIVMDDIWDAKVWDKIKRILPDDSNGSRIMITTRIKDVALYVGTSGFFHELQFLNEDQGWYLFSEKVFCPSELEDIGRMIANSCRGLPLAIVVVAGLLSKMNKTCYDWKEIAKSVSSAANENDEHFSKILSLSYNHLPHHLKACFLYMGGFPEDHEIRTSKLIKLWIAEGFLKPIESKSLEEVAHDYLEDLISRNLVLVPKRGSDGRFKHCSIHDILRELCMERARHENFHHILDKNDDFHAETTRLARRLYIHVADSEFTEEAEECGSHVRSILCFGDVKKFLSFASSSKLLRVLDMPKIHFWSFPNEILELFHLRYLALYAAVAFNLPRSTSKLENLQTLILESKYNIPPLPRLQNPQGTLILITSIAFDEGFDISSLSHLRHVMVRRLQFPPIPFAILENLQTLSKMINVKFTNEVIEMIPNLQKLKVCYYDNTYQKWKNYGLNNLFRLGQLDTLDIYFPTLIPRDPDPSFPENFAFPLKLKKLSLKGCGLSWKDLTVVGSLPNLEVLKLRNHALEGEEWVPVEGEFTKLKFLLMDNLNLKYWRADNTHFPRLEQLKIISFWYLEEIPLEIGEIPTLELIEVHECKLAADSAIRIQEEQQDQGNDVLQVRVSF